MNWIKSIVRPGFDRMFRNKDDTPDNLWVSCGECGEMIFHRDLELLEKVCPGCDHHMRIGTYERFKQLFDEGAFKPIETPTVPLDPLKFKDQKKYADRLRDAQTKTGRKDAVSIGLGTIDGQDAVIAVQDFSFMGGSLGMAAGEAVVTAGETALKHDAPLIMIIAAGGARMQEGILSLMQMPRTTVIVQELRARGLPYIVVLTDPTTGGVTASYGMLGDIHIAEPGALIGFAGPRVIQDTIKEKLPEGFQRAEYLFEHGMVDMVVHRHKLRETLARLIRLLTAPKSLSDAPSSAALLEAFFSLHPKRIDLTLDRIARLLRALGNPQLACPPTIHIAGTNGKGSTLAFLRAMLEADGARVHSYSSPHLIRFHERINLGGRDIDEARLIACLEHCRRVNGAAPITFFEITTAAAFLAFSQTPADYLLLETGLGGRLDATNLAAPIASVITPISLDHQDFLGETLAEIAAEKAGILKPDTPAIIAPQAEAARDIICARADALGIALSLGGRDWQVRSDYGRLAFETLAGLRDLPLPNLAGAHQLVNAGTAIATALQLGIGDASIERGLTQARWAGRLTRLDAQLWLDGGHNEAAAIALAQWCAAHDTPTQIILGLMAHKNADAFLGAFAKCDKIARVLTIAIPDQDKSFSAKTLAQKARGLGLDATPFADLESALNSATETSGRILICGSLYLAGAVLRARAN